MNSINRNQPENNREDLDGGKAIDKIKEIVKKAQTCFFCTAEAADGSSGARPMNVRQVDSQGHLWFLSASDSHTNQEIGFDPTVRLFFQGSPHSDFLQLQGHAAVSRDRAMVKELWEPHIKTWFTEGVDDPRLTVIEVTPTDGYYWDTKHGNLVAGIKIAIGAAIGRTLDDSIEGKLKL
jgi:general stress protein 26